MRYYLLLLLSLLLVACGAPVAPPTTPADIQTQVQSDVSGTMFADNIQASYVATDEAVRVTTMIADTNSLDNEAIEVKSICFDMQQAIWNDHLLHPQTVEVDMLTTFQDSTGHQLAAVRATCTLTAVTAATFVWANLNYEDGWDEHIYDVEQYPMTP